MTRITLTPAQLTLAQMGKEITLNTGETLFAQSAPQGWPQWRYMLLWQGEVGLIRYADSGLKNALWALNAPESEYLA